MFTLRIETDNAAFCPDNEDAPKAEHLIAESTETARILRRIADRIDDGGETNGRIVDSNGNTVGEFSF